jgi:5'-nucleotidase (lipoprotein e(P4) family)
MQTRAVVLVVFAFVGSACGARAVVPATAPVPGQDPEAIQWVRDSAEFQAAFHQAYRDATRRVEAAAAGRASGSWAVVLDADETVISNVIYQVERSRQGLGFTPESWKAWVERREATPLPAAPEFLHRVRALGGRIAIVTNRLVSECEDTAFVFRRHELPFDAMLCRPDGSPSDKNSRFEAVRRGTAEGIGTPVEVIAYLGDNIHDFPELSQKSRQLGAEGFREFGVRYFILPNPMYGGWQARE